MKLKFERYPEYSCFYVRGQVEAEKLKILMIGLDSLIKDAEEPIIVHLGLAQLSPQEVTLLAAFKKKLGAYKKVSYWIHPERSLGEFKSFEIFTNRTLSAKAHYIGDRILLDDDIYVLHEKITHIQNEIGTLGGSEDSVKKIILENDILKTQKDILDQSLAAQHTRMVQQSLKPSTDAEIASSTATAHADLVKAVGSEVPL